MTIQSTAVTLETITSFCKRRGFIYPSGEIYGGLNGIYDTGPLGALLKENIRKAWTKSLKQLDYDVLFLEGALIGSSSMWEASGHVENFHDPMVDCLICKHRYRANDIDLEKGCPHCGGRSWTDVRQFNMMFKTQLGASLDASSTAYLRPETAQAIFINFKNVISSNRVKIPFGIAQIGKAFRNEITPKQFIFRMREFEQMEIEWFCAPETAADFFEFWKSERLAFYHSIGIKPERIRIRAHEKDELSHYSKGTSDVEYHFPFGWKELEGIANRGDYDLRQHSKYSGKDLGVYNEETKESYLPHVVECSVGVDRLMLAILCGGYHEEMVEGEQRIVLQIHPTLSPIKAAFMPLTKVLAQPMMELYKEFKRKGYSVQYDESGSIGRRYRRQDEIGTPLCFTYDFESAGDKSVTVRHRDTMKQERIALTEIENYIKNYTL